MEWFKKFGAGTGLLAALTFGTGFVVGCEDDNAIEDAADDAGDAVEDAVDDTGDAIEDATD